MTSGERLMMRAVALSRRGYPAPNPHVGCVLARNGEIVGEGYHAYAGGPHAEVVALGRAGGNARGATAYVTLEPCAHHGRTPPCADALIDAGVSEVAVAVPDPNREAAGGLLRLRDAGIRTTVGLCAAAAAAANERFLESMRLRRPFVVAKAAMSVDGRIALPSGESRWITGEESRRMGHRLRAECGAVLVGRVTVQTDDPLLTARVPGVRNQPLKVVLDPNGVLTGGEIVFCGSGETLWCVRNAQRPGQEEIPAGEGGLDLSLLLDTLFARGVTGLLVEGGSTTLQSFLSLGLIDRLELFVSPMALGGGRSWLEGEPAESLARASRFRFARVRRLGDDLWITARPRKV
jgi:diaminohydroxyphosphoribosylaminopyrimidine deaminase / 5-amino-6-(5-phosphoribosylamino)uracil reductase